MKALVLSRFSLGELYTKLRRLGIKEFVDFYKIRKAWRSDDDIVSVITEQKCNTAVVISNFFLALRIMQRAGFKRVFVVIPKRAFGGEILKADIYTIEAGEVKVTKYEDKKRI